MIRSMFKFNEAQWKKITINNRQTTHVKLMIFWIKNLLILIIKISDINKQ